MCVCSIRFALPISYAELGDRLASEWVLDRARARMVAHLWVHLDVLDRTIDGRYGLQVRPWGSGRKWFLPARPSSPGLAQVRSHEAEHGLQGLALALALAGWLMVLCLPGLKHGRFMNHEGSHYQGIVPLVWLPGRPS